MAIEYPPLIPDLLTRFGINPLDFTSYTDLLRELQALFNAIGTNPAGASGTVDGRLDAIEGAIASPAKAVITSDSTAIANTTTETAFSNGKLTVAANTVAIGTTFRINAGGKYSTMSGSPGTLTFHLRWGNVITDPLVWNQAGIALSPSISNGGWAFSCIATIRTLGSSGSIAASGYAGVGLPVTITTTLSKDLTVFAQWSVANAANTITLQSFLAEQVN